ncbi:fibronectin type III domain-containing protein [Fulvivirga ulvae]|uniref:fibronectin type III domain-containing protein n=1 Tax=Fulvivirga ulvae TaxID=2904245 RepID=UPI001F4176EC|nr:fibronectin type III domain-containing protein [Fulvivirga ulvae]UII30975.1 fibronectin type III domain-containing protein [Fulvivirga ulvae]
MKRNLTTVLIILLASMALSAQVPKDYYYIVPGTMSYRMDGSSSPQLKQDTLVRGTYYGSNNGGAMTGFNSSQYKDFTLFRHPTNSNWITDPHQVDLLPKSGNGGFNQGNNKWLLNYRIAYPTDFDSLGSDLKPLIVFMHGAGERGDCWGGNCYGENDPRMWNNDHNLQHGGRQHVEAINRNSSDPRHWPGFVVFPQNKNGYNPGPGLDTWTGRVIALVEQLIKKYPIDPNKIYIHGLSEGAQGTWMLINSRPDLFAAAAPMSGHRDHGAFDTDVVSPDTTMIHMPVWQFQGGRDTRPKPSSTEQKLNKIKNLGGTPRYTLYPTLGHGVWNTAYAEPDFFSWFLQYSKLTIHGYYGVKAVCEGDEVNVRLGISKGFDEYEWRKIKDGVTTAVAPSPERDNEIIADDFASYQVRFRRGSQWTEWSEPYTITEKPRPTAKIIAEGSTALPGLDGSTEVTLSTDEQGIYYEWYKNGTLYLHDSTLNAITVSDPGAYSLVVKDEGLCKGFESNKIYVSNEPYLGSLPAAPDNIHASASSATSINVYWQDKSDDELGFEVYRSTDGINFSWVTTTTPNKLLYADTALNSATTYYYKVRAYNTNGPSSPSEVASATTLTDSQKPTAPGNFKFDNFAYTEHRINVTVDNLADEYFTVHTDQVVLSWSPSTDNVGVTQYKVYFLDGTLAATTSNTTATVTGLEKEKTYSFYVVAYDNAGNASSPSSAVSVTTVLEGLYFNLFAGGTWDVVKDFSDWALHANGAHPNFRIAVREDYTEDDDYFAFDFFGYIYITTPGTYTFYTTSDDGSQLWIGGTKVVDNDGLHGSVERSGTISLTAGAHPITVKYFERSGGHNLQVSYRGPTGSGINKQQIPDSALKSGYMPEQNLPDTPTNLTANADATEFSIDLNWDYESTDIVVLGSSTAYGAEVAANESWVERLDSTMLANNANYTLTNLAANGLNTYHVRATGTSGGGYFADPSHNITAALALNPDIIIVNLPSNNVADNIDASTTVVHYNELLNLASAQDVEIFFTTTQPRNFNTNSAKRHLLETEADAVRASLDDRVIDIYDYLTDFSNDNRIKAQFDSGDGTHLNSSGHYYILTEVLKTVGPYMPKFEVYASESGGSYEIVHTTGYGETAYTHAELSPSTSFTYRVKAVNIYGSSGFSNTAGATSPADVVAPSVPQNLWVRAKTDTQIALSWDNSVDNVGVTEYIVSYALASEGSGSRIGSSARTQAETVSTVSNGVTIEGLSPETEYMFSVAARDGANNTSIDSDPITVETLSDSPLPVEFIDFSYTINGNSVNLNWITGSELNNEYFSVERAVDINEFTEIGTVNGSGTTTSAVNYEFTDYKPLNLAYYRIKQVDFDGGFSYSKVIRVTLKNNFDELTVYPNPASPNNINIKGYIASESDRVSINFFDVMGKSSLLIETDPNTLLEGLTIDARNNLHTGVYIVEISDGNNKSQKRVIIR